MQKTYSTNEVSKIIGIHSNTVRMYEDLGLISKPMRKENGYRIFTDLHIWQFQLARTAFQIEILQNGLRKKAVDIVKTTAICDFDSALRLTKEYMLAIKTEINYANEAVSMVKELLYNTQSQNKVHLKRKDVSEQLDITMDTLRNWEMNGLLKIKRKENGYRVYMDEDIKKIKIIRTLKCANYSLSAILRMINALDKDASVNINKVLNTPCAEDDIISVCDKLVISLKNAKENALSMEHILLQLKKEYSNPPL